MSAENDPNLWRWLVGTAIALLGAGGGVVALLRHFRPSRPKLLTNLWLLASPYYELLDDGEKKTVRRNQVALPGPAEVKAGGGLYPSLELHVTNPTGKRVSVNAIRFSFGRVEAVKPPAAAEIVVQYLPGTSAERRAELERKYGLRLSESEGEMYTYRLDGAAAADLVERIEREADAVKHAFTNEVGAPHKQFPVAEKVNVKLQPGRKDYLYLVSHTVAANDTLKIPISVGATESLTAAGSVALVFEADKTHDVGELELTLEVPGYVETAGGV